VNNRPAGDCYQLRYRWTVEGPIDTIFTYVSDGRTFKDWFFVFKEVIPDDPDQGVEVGAHTRFKVKALLPYLLDWHVTVTNVDRPHLLETAVQVTLSGRFPMSGYIRYRFQEEGGLVVVENEQELCSERRLPGPLRRLAQAAFTLNHDWAMRRAEEPLRRVVRAAAERAAAENPGQAAL